MLQLKAALLALPLTGALIALPGSTDLIFDF
jgi:hypothetical protein